jgi:hypothetical protein
VRVIAVVRIVRAHPDTIGGAAMPEQITESVKVTEAESLGNGKYRVLVISAGTGSSGEYPAETLREAANKGLVAPGLHSYWDHPSASEDKDRPERSVRDLVGVFTSGAQWDEALQGLVADYQVFSPYRPLFEEMRPHVGLSIRGGGEIEMRNGKRVITSLEHLSSVDVVTKAGRGGRVLELLESARPDTVNARAVANGVAEATANERRELLQDALKTTFGAEDVYVWVRDFDDASVWFDLDTPDESATWQLTYTAGDSGVALSGEPIRVRAETQYVPVDPAADTPTQESQEDTMPQIEEARMRELEEAAGRVPTLESERDAAVQRATQAEAVLAEATARATIRPTVVGKVAESKTLGSRTQARLVESIVAGLPVVDGKVTDEALAAAVESAVKAAEAEIADYAPAAPQSLYGSFGSVNESAGGEQLTESDFDAAVGGAFGRTGKGN